MPVIHMWLLIRVLGLLNRAWIAQSVEHQTFNLRVQGSSPCSGDSMHACSANETMLTEQAAKSYQLP